MNNQQATKEKDIEIEHLKKTAELYKDGYEKLLKIFDEFMEDSKMWNSIIILLFLCWFLMGIAVGLVAMGVKL